MKIDYSGIIRIMRGDSFRMPLPINMGTTMDPVYKQLEENEFLYFGVMEPNQAFEDAVLKKKYDKDSEKDEDGNTLLILNPEDTLDLLVGTYYYSLKLVRKDSNNKVEYVKTLISPTQFWLLGNNPIQKGKRRHEVGKDDINQIVYDGGVEYIDEKPSTDIIYDGGEESI